MEGTIGEIRIFAGNFAPRNWALCQGQIIAIRTNTALFSILGTTYGGDGKVTFALPDFQGRLCSGTGNNTQGLTPIQLGEQAGTTTNMLISSEMPSHTHQVNVNNAATGRSVQLLPGSNYFAQNQNASSNFDDQADSQMNPMVIQPTGSNAPINNMQPYLGINFIICMYGYFPSRH